MINHILSACDMGLPDEFILDIQPEKLKKTNRKYNNKKKKVN